MKFWKKSVHDLMQSVTIAFYVLWHNGGFWGPEQSTATRLLFAESRKITLNGLEHVKHNGKRYKRKLFSRKLGRTEF